jgi:hypothetical protein
MRLDSRLERMEQALGVYQGYEPQCRISLRFLGQVLSCPADGCWDGCARAKEILLGILATMEKRMMDDKNDTIIDNNRINHFKHRR